METMKNFNLVIMGSSGVGKSSLRSAWSHNRKDFSNMGPTETVTFSSETFLNNHIAMKDFGSSEEGRKLQHRRATYGKVDGMIFVFNAVEKDKTQDLEQFMRAWKLLSTESPNAKVFVFFHRTDLIKRNQTEALCSFGAQLKNALVASHASQRNKMKLLPTSVYNKESVFDAWSTVFQSLCGSPEGWSDRLSIFGSGMGFDQVIVFDKRHKILVENVILNENKLTLDNMRCQAKVSGWWEKRDRVDCLVIEGERRIHVHDYIQNSILIGITDNDMITPLSCRFAVKGFKRLELNCQERNRNSKPSNEKRDQTRSCASQTPTIWQPSINIVIKSMSQLTLG